MIQKLFLLSLFLTFVSFYSCQNKVENIDQAISLEKSEMAISHGDQVLNSMAFFNRLVGKDSLLIFDGTTNQLIVFDLKTENILYEFSPPKEGPNFFDFPIMDIEVQNEKLFVLSASYFSIYNLEGKVLQRWSANEIQGFRTEYIITDFELINEEEVLLNKVPFEALFGKKSDSSYDPNLFMVLNLVENYFTDLPVKSPKEALLSNSEFGYYQDFSFHNALINKDKIVYSFPFSTKTYTFNIKDKSQSTVQSSSDFVTNLREPANINSIGNSAWVDYTYSSAKFSKLSRDPITGYYARILTEFKTLSDGTNVNEKFIMILNENLQVIYETKLPTAIIDEPLFSDGVVYLKKLNQTKEDVFEFFTYQIN